MLCKVSILLSLLFCPQVVVIALYKFAELCNASVVVSEL